MPFCPKRGCDGRTQGDYCPKCGTDMSATTEELDRQAAQELDSEVVPPPAECPKDAEGKPLPLKKAFEQAKLEWVAVCSVCKRVSSRKDHECGACPKRNLQIKYEKKFHPAILNLPPYYTLSLVCPDCRLYEAMALAQCPHCDTPIGPHHIFAKQRLMALSSGIQWILEEPGKLAWAISIGIIGAYLGLLFLQHGHPLPAAVGERAKDNSIIIATAGTFGIWVSLAMTKLILTKAEWRYRPIAEGFHNDAYHDKIRHER